MGKILDINSPTTFVKIKFSLKHHEDRLNRTMLVDKNISLIDLGYAIGASVGCTFEHMFEFYAHGSSYSHNPYFPEDKELACHYLKDLGSSFSFTYDFGEDWEFVCKAYKKEVTLDTENRVIVLEGVGQGIWEDNRYSLEMYLEGELDPDSGNSIEEDGDGVYLPWNFEFTKFGDFDNPIDVEYLTIKANTAIDCKDMYGWDSEMNGSDEFDDESDEYFEDEDAYELDLDSDDIDLDKLFGRFLNESFAIHFTNNEFVDEKITELSKKYSHQEAIQQVFNVYCDYIMRAVYGDKPYSFNQYKKELEKLE